jgi:DNA polymerase-4
MNSKAKLWRRMIAFVVVEHFPVAVEELDNPLLHGRPVGVVSGEQGRVLVAASAAARARDLEAGMDWSAAKARCPELARVVARPARHAELSRRMMAALAEAVTPEIEVFAPGAAFLDLTRCQAYYRHDVERIATLIRDTVRQASGLACAVGLSGDKTTARWAAGQQAEGMRVVAPDTAEAQFAPLPLHELCGLAPAVTEFFAGYGVQRCGDMKKIPASVPARRFGNLGRRLWLMAQGRDPAPVETATGVETLLALGKLLPPHTADAAQLQQAFLQLAEKTAQRLRHDQLALRDFRVELRAPEGWRREWLQADAPTDDARAIFALCRRFLRRHWFGESVPQIRLACGKPGPVASQAEIFDSARRPAPASAPEKPRKSPRPRATPGQARARHPANPAGGLPVIPPPTEPGVHPADLSPAGG